MTATPIPPLRPLGKLFKKLGILYYDPLFGEWYVTLAYKIDRLICVFKGHDYHWYFRFPKKGERPNNDDCGMMRIQNERCSRCWHPKYGIDLE